MSANTTVTPLMPISKSEYLERIEQVRAIMRENSLDGLVLSDFVPNQQQMYSWQPNASYVRYLSGFNLPEMTGPYGAVLVIPLEGEPTLVVPPGALRSSLHIARQQSWIENVICTYHEDLAWEEKTWWGLLTNQGADVAQALRESGLDRGHVAVAGSWTGFEETKSMLSDVEFTSTLVEGGEDSLRSHTGGKRDILQPLIGVATPAEIERLMRSHDASDAAVKAYIDAAKSGATQQEALVAGKVAGILAGAEDVWFIGTVDVKPFIFQDLSVPVPSARFKEGEIYFVETAQASVEGYKIQTVRSFVLGTPTESQIRLMQTIKEAIEVVLKEMRPGITGGEIWDIASSVGRAAGYEPWVVYGHSEGYKPHPRQIAFGPGDRNVVESGQVVNLHISFRDVANDHIGMSGDTYLVEDDGWRPLATDPPPLDEL